MTTLPTSLSRLPPTHPPTHTAAEVKVQFMHHDWTRTH